jgi:hypothetical protein
VVRRVGILVALCAVVGLLGGCSSTCGPTPDCEPEEAAGGPDRTSPDRTLTSLSEAYADMDLDAYLDCLADDFLFHTREEDQNDSENPLPTEWDRSAEIAMHWCMFGPETAVDRIRLTLTALDSTFIPGDSPDTFDDRWLYTSAVDLAVIIPPEDGGEDLILFTSVDQEFEFGVDPDETGADGEDLWEVISWRDLEDGGGQRVENASWGRIKFLFC